MTFVGKTRHITSATQIQCVLPFRILQEFSQGSHNRYTELVEYALLPGASPVCDLKVLKHRFYVSVDHVVTDVKL